MTKTPKEQLLELAGRIEASSDGLSNVSTHFWDALGELEKRLYKGTVKHCEVWHKACAFESIAAALEKELLPDENREQVIVLADWCKGYNVQWTFYIETQDDEGAPYWMPHKAVEATAPTEPLARLAAILRCLAEMEKSYE